MNIKKFFAGVILAGGITLGSTPLAQAATIEPATPVAAQISSSSSLFRFFNDISTQFNNLIRNYRTLAPSPTNNGNNFKSLHNANHAVSRPGIHEGINAYRASLGAQHLYVDPQLDASAQAWAERLARENGGLYHQDMNTVMRQTGVRAVAENILQTYPGATNAQAIQQWINSPGHHANLKNGKYNRVGTGVAVSPTGKIYAVQVFGLR